MKLTIFFALLALAQGAAAEFVSRVIDGDTIVVAENDRQLHIRLANIDAPEMRQPYGPVARQQLVDLVGGKDVELHASGKDRWGRVVARVTVHGVDVQRRAVREGWAWCYPKPAPDPACEDDEAYARANHIGLWKQESPTPPWEWRRQAH